MTKIDKFLKITIVVILSIMCSFNFNDPSERQLQNLLNSETHSQSYQTNVFDCTEMVSETEALLTNHGYDAKIAYSTWDPDPDRGHVWVVVYVDGKTINVGTVSDDSMGFITYTEEYNTVDKIFENEIEMRSYGIY